MKVKIKKEYMIHSYNARDTAKKIMERFNEIGYYPSQKSVENCLASPNPKYSLMIRIMNALNMIESEEEC